MSVPVCLLLKLWARPVPLGIVYYCVCCTYNLLHMYTHESSTQDVQALRTKDGGLKIFYDRSTLPRHPLPQILMHMVYIVLLVTNLGLFEG